MVILRAIGKLSERLSRTREKITSRIVSLFQGRSIDEEALDDLREVLISADVGVAATEKIVARVEDVWKEKQNTGECDVLEIIRTVVSEMLSASDCSLRKSASGPTVILVAGVNGSGKTTTIGKLACRLRDEGAKVIVAASDTYRPAAIEQLEIWAKRAGVGIVRHDMGGDPSAVVFDAIEAASARDIDYVIIDTAGRLQTKANLMEELTKIKRVASRKIPEAPHEVLIVLDANVGQNALSQVRLFDEAVGLTGIIISKMDSTSKGGVLLAVRDHIDLPVKYIGVGESPEDLEPFDAERFAEALFGEQET